MALSLFRSPQDVPRSIRWLAYASILLTIPMLVFIPKALGPHTFVPVALIVVTWIYHAIVILDERQGHHTQVTAYSSKRAVLSGTTLSLLWTLWTALLSVSFAILVIGQRGFPPYFAYHFLDCVFHIAQVAVLWALRFEGAKRHGRAADHEQPSLDQPRYTDNDSGDDDRRTH